jgi:probable rRNA maturation factor
MNITLTNQQDRLPLDEALVRSVAERVLAEAEITAGSLSIVVVDDETIHDLNRRFLDHDYATDVLSFALESRPSYLEGEVIVSADTAAATAPEFDWPAEHELLLYVLHGLLHLVGYNDKGDHETAEMRSAERRILAACGIEVPRPVAAMQEESR